MTDAWSVSSCVPCIVVCGEKGTEITDPRRPHMSPLYEVHERRFLSQTLRFCDKSLEHDLGVLVKKTIDVE